MHGAAYTAEDIKKYLRGEMSPAEMHALEKAALDDPFLADAIEGMEKNTSGFEENITDLRKRIRSSNKKRPTVRIYWKAAAAVLFIAATAVALLVLTENKPGKQEQKVLAKVESKTDTAATVLRRTDEPAVMKPREKTEGRQKVLMPPAHAAKDEEQIATITETEKAISIADSIQEAAPANDSSVTKALAGRSSGMEVQKNTRLDEVVVVGYSAKKKEAKARSVSSIEARNMEAIVPEGGWDAFDHYLNENKNIPGADSLKRGVQIVSFTIDKNGRPQDLKIRRSISSSHDTESIRLLQNGPNWKIIKGKKRKVRLEIMF